MPLDSLEYVVRPYQTRAANGAVIIPSTPSGSRERATLTWGAKATMPARKEAEGIAFEVVCCQEGLEENSRKSETKRIYGGDGSEENNWVDVERPMSLKLKKKGKNGCGDDWDQISGVAQEVDAALAQFAGDIHSGTASVGGGENCSVGWKFKNE